MDSSLGIIAGIPGGRLRLLPNSAASKRIPLSSADNFTGGGCARGVGMSGWERVLPAEDDFGLLFAAEGNLLESFLLAALVAGLLLGGGPFGGAGLLNFS